MIPFVHVCRVNWRVLGHFFASFFVLPKATLATGAAEWKGGLRVVWNAGGLTGTPVRLAGGYQPRTQAKISGATMVASDSMMNRGVSTLNFPQVIFSLGTAPE